MRWDAYKATIPERPERLVTGICERMPSTWDTITEGPGMHSYVRSDTIRDAMGTRIAVVLSGGRNPAPHVIVSGVYTVEVARIIRDTWPMHTVSRADSAYDLDEPGCFEGLSVAFQTFAHRHGLQWDVRGDWREEGVRDDMRGRTFYVGSRKSLAYLRVYEKGKQILEECSDADDLPSIDWVRCEIEVKPQDREQKSKLAYMTPEQAWGVSNWVRAAHRVVTGFGTERVIMWEPKESEAYRAFRHMSAQYQTAIDTILADKGGPEGLIAFYNEVLETQGRRKAEAKARPIVRNGKRAA